MIQNSEQTDEHNTNETLGNILILYLIIFSNHHLLMKMVDSDVLFENAKLG